MGNQVKSSGRALFWGWVLFPKTMILSSKGCNLMVRYAYICNGIHNWSVCCKFWAVSFVSYLLAISVTFHLPFYLFGCVLSARPRWCQVFTDRQWSACCACLPAGWTALSEGGTVSEDRGPPSTLPAALWSPTGLELSWCLECDWLTTAAWDLTSCTGQFRCMWLYCGVHYLE